MIPLPWHGLDGQMQFFSCAPCHVTCNRGDIFEIAAASCHCGGDSIVTAPFEATEEERARAHDLGKLRNELQSLAGQSKSERVDFVDSTRSRHRDLSLSRAASEGQEDPTPLANADTEDSNEESPYVLRRSDAGSRLDLLAPISEKQVGKRWTLALSRAINKLSCSRCLRCSLVDCDRDKVIKEVIFGDYLSTDGLTVDAENWFQEVQHERFVESRVNTPRSSPSKRSAAKILSTLLEDANLPHRLEPCAHLERPLSEYWINSSHNSYLQGNQLTSTSSAHALASLLRNGCRVIELDVYDGSKYGMQGPCVLHGGTATTAVSLCACLEAIKEAAFENSACPVIITLENYLSPDGQRRCASLLLDVLGDSLYVPPPQIFEWPPPGELLKRFLLRDKSWHSEDASPKSNAASPCPRAARVPELHRFISIGNVKFRSFKECQLWQGCTSSSFSETKLLQLIAKSGLQAMRSYTAVHLARIYPAGYRVDSSNYDPQDGWEAGCQMVALNGQKSIFFHPHAAWLNAGRFRGNGGCGFVPKPSHMMSDEEPQPKKLSITVLGGDGWEAFRDFDLLGPPDSYVCVEIAGASADRRLEKTSVYTARVKTGPKAQPVWKQSFEFAISDAALAVVMLVAWDQDVDFDDLLGQYAFPLADLKPGWRRVPLLSSSGELQEGNPALICRFELQ